MRCDDAFANSLPGARRVAVRAAPRRVALGTRRGVTAAASRPARAMVMAEEAVAVPKGMNRYETMFLMLPDASEDELSKEIAKLEGFLLENGAVHVETLNRGRQPLAYTIRGFPEVVYVQFNYVAPGKTAAALETELARPVLGDRKLVMRFQTKLY